MTGFAATDGGPRSKELVHEISPKLGHLTERLTKEVRARKDFDQAKSQLTVRREEVARLETRVELTKARLEEEEMATQESPKFEDPVAATASEKASPVVPISGGDSVSSVPAETLEARPGQPE